MSRISWVISLAGIIFVLFSCGRRTAPEPYDAFVESLPAIQINRPVFKADQLMLNWQIIKSGSKSELDVSTDAFHVKVYKNIETCYTCENKPIEVITIAVKEDQSRIRLKNSDSYSELVRHWHSENTHNLLINRKLTDYWYAEGFFFFTVSYSTVEGLLSKESDAFWPVYGRAIPKPEITVTKRLDSVEPMRINAYIEWKLIREAILTKIENNGNPKEIEIYYGINLYRSLLTEDLRELKLINPEPLMKGKYSFLAGDYRILVSHVDRFGNESESITLLLPQAGEHENELTVIEPNGSNQ
ncbi:hypothetical protein KJ966_22305 [bacterium]|nr:hypothetical protein [bacterium]